MTPPLGECLCMYFSVTAALWDNATGIRLASKSYNEDQKGWLVRAVQQVIEQVG